jgi:hypothetical protein
MAHDVFISYSSKDNTQATAVCSTLEDHKIRCWIAPRDVPPGMHYGAALDHAIANSKVFVLVLSRGSNASDQVIRELEIAADVGIPIIPVRIEDFEPTEAVRYYIKSVHWLDAMTPPIERHLEILAARVQAMLNLDIPQEPQPAPVRREELRPPVRRKPMPRWAIIGVGGSAVLLLALLGLWLSGGLGLFGSGPREFAADRYAAGWSEWRSLSFVTPILTDWDLSEEGAYYAKGVRSHDVFAWSKESFDGDLVLKFDLQAKLEQQTHLCIIVYGDGVEFTRGNLIFLVGSDLSLIEKHTRYHEGDSFLTYNETTTNLVEQKVPITIEIIGDSATMYLDEQPVASALIDVDDINHSGRIGLLKPWYSGGGIFSNLRVSTPIQ